MDKQATRRALLEYVYSTSFDPEAVTCAPEGGIPNIEALNKFKALQNERFVAIIK